MTLFDLLQGSYEWANLHATALFLVALAIPIVGTIAARIGKAGRTDRDGRFIASAVIGISAATVIALIAGVLIAHLELGRSLLEANALLLVAPLVCFGGSLVGIRWVFPLNELASIRTLVDVSLFVLAGLAGIWFISRFRWGILFWGSFSDLLFVLGLASALLFRLYRRAFGHGRRAVVPE